MRTHSTFACALLVSVIGARGMLSSAAEPAPPATQPSNAPADAQAAKPDRLKAEMDERHKHVDARWQSIQDSMRNNSRTRWIDAPVLQKFNHGGLVHLSMHRGLINAAAADLASAAPVRVSVEGSKSIWTLGRSRGVFNNAAGQRAVSSFTNIIRYDFDAKGGEYWNSRLLVGDGFMTFTAQNLYGSAILSQSATGVSLRVTEYAQWGQPPITVCSVQSATLEQLRAEHPEEFRLYALPVMRQFGDLAFLTPGAGDVYSAFGEIPADPMVVQQIAQIVPLLDADDPVERDNASGRLAQLGMPAVIAALHWDESGLSEEQKLRLETFVDGFRRRDVLDPSTLRRDPHFLVDCLEYDDPAVRTAARLELEKVTGHPVTFDTTLTGEAAARAADLLRKTLLAPASAAQSDVPATQPSPQS